ncbi:hypothetical protein [Phytopseudomonas punonensis]|nr:hypothetical protein [Pseudomonas punonensis]
MNIPPKKRDGRRQELLLALARGEQAIVENRIHSHAQAKKKLGRWLN